MPRYQRHVFVCVNRRSEEDPRGCCSARGSEEIRALFKKGIRSRGLSSVVRANAAGCLDACGFGATVVIYPEGVWYGRVRATDVDEIIEKHVLRGEIIERLLIRPYAGEASGLPPIEPPPATTGDK